MRMLAAASGGEGHLGPLLPFVRAARDAGDDVLLVVPPGLADTARSTGCAVHVTDAPDAGRSATCGRRWRPAVGRRA
jgi:UDP:flavonoid glycosyltransferase YjiC (YdhE family)